MLNGVKHLMPNMSSEYAIRQTLHSAQGDIFSFSDR